MASGTGTTAPRPSPPQTVVVSFDSSALVTLLLQKRGWKGVKAMIENPAVEAIGAGAALTESVEVSRRKGNTSSGAQIREALETLGVEFVNPATEDQLRAAELVELSKGNPGPPHPIDGHEPTLPLGDALCLAVSERLGARVLTEDKYWKWMVDHGLLTLTVVIPS